MTVAYFGPDGPTATNGIERENRSSMNSHAQRFIQICADYEMASRLKDIEPIIR
jgi:hypothetical protein